MLKIIIADDHPMIRTGVKFTIREHYNNLQLFEAKNGDELIMLVKQHEIDVVLLDLNMPDTDPQQVLETILVLNPSISVIIFSMSKEEIFGYLYLKMGAKGYLKKGGEDAELIKAIKCVLDGNVYIPKEMLHFYLGGDKGGGNNDNPFSLLTRKELEVLRHLAKGESVIGTARTMNLSSSTIGTHKANIFEKLRIGNMLELRAITELYGF